MNINDKLISDNRIVSSMSVPRASIITVPPDRDRIPRNNKKKTFRNFGHRE